uniref:NADH dehydrogenase subunit 5 n=1 Tax=Limnonectes blythii TaxID=109962 RepID=UPI00226CAB8D|nr:NADH dehydrogenase subunit 5 [Limnonectes blythii]UZC57500.1 NADH dehydrogenase subunit 5 [Limnonectes blythii]
MHTLTTLIIYMIITVKLTSPLLQPTTLSSHFKAKQAVKHAFLLSFIPLISLIFIGSDNTMDSLVKLDWLNMGLATLDLNFKFDKYQIIFMIIAFFVTWCILQFSSWYMLSDPKMTLFFKHLLLFLFAMIFFTSAGNLISLFIGWEGVGIMSFLLIGWYSARNDAAVAALQAVLYNRIGDIGFVLAFCWLLKNSLSTSLDYIFSTTPPTILILAFIIAAASKSSQFMMHPWLISAMEGPTPVSALLHSSTMVVAGVFLLIRVHPFISQNQIALSTCLCLGAISSAFAAYCALTQNDIKKIIAFSTSSQLGLMMVTIGLDLPNLAFFHICTHAFFKSMLFLCAGVIIHNLWDEQDIRHMGGIFKILPMTTSCITVGSLALMGTPFLIGFYSKDAIIEATTNSYANTLAILLTLMATAFTAAYSLRIIYFVLMNQPRFIPPVSLDEKHPSVKGSIPRLAIGTIITGPLLYFLLFPDLPTTHTMPTYMKLAALIITLLSFVIAYDLARLAWLSSPKDDAKAKKSDPTFYNQLLHRTVVTVTLDTAWKVITHVLEESWTSLMGAHEPPKTMLPPTKVIQTTHKAMIQLYMGVLFINLIMAFIFVSFL